MATVFTPARKRSLAIVGVLATAVLISQFGLGGSPFTPRLEPVNCLVSQDRTECELASLGRIRFTEATIDQLLMLPGMTEAIASELIHNRPEILSQAKKLAREQQWRALEIAHGVGPKKAAAFDRFLELD
jgi:hypothetical protein